jgi:hypothetical protein
MKRLLPICLLLAFAAQASDTPPPPAETDEAKFIRLTTQLEQDPLGDPDKSVRTWLLNWATESKDVSVLACDVLGPTIKQDVPNGPDLITQYLFGNAAFQIAHADQRNDLVATQFAGIRSSMRAYSSLLVHFPDARIKYYDSLLAKDRDGTLEAFLKPIIIKKCK